MNEFGLRSVWLATLLTIMIDSGVAMNARADETVQSNEPGQWTGKGEAGLALSSSTAGATSDTVNAKIGIAYQSNKWKHAFDAAGLYAANSDSAASEKEVTANRWDVGEQSDYTFAEDRFWFGGVRHEEDRVGSFQYQSAISTGLGYKFFDTERTKLSAQVGAGYKLFKPNVIPPAVEAHADHDLIATALVNYSRSLTGNTMLQEKLSVESGTSNSVVQNDLGLQIQMTNLLAIALAYEVRYNSSPGVGFGHYDRLTTVNLVYELKKSANK